MHEAERGMVLAYAGEEQDPQRVPATLYGGTWAVVACAEIATHPLERKLLRKAGIYTVLHRGTGRGVAFVPGEARCGDIAWALARRLPRFASGASLGDSPDEEEETRDLVRVIAAVDPGARIGHGQGPTAAELDRAARRVESEERGLDGVDAGGDDDEDGVAA